jgi:hypothetical protein
MDDISELNHKANKFSIVHLLKKLFPHLIYQLCCYLYFNIIQCTLILLDSSLSKNLTEQNYYASVKLTFKKVSSKR